MILVRSWAALSAAALAVSLLHALVDWHIGLFGVGGHEILPIGGHEAAR